MSQPEKDMKQPSVLWVGNPFFQSGLAALGLPVHHIDPPLGAVLDWKALIAAAGFIPDILVAGDKSSPPFLSGIESFPCLTVFYAVDSHIHSWFPHYAQGFDIVLAALRDHLPLFYNGRLPADRIWWSPSYAASADVPRSRDPLKPAWDVLFAGTVDPAINPERCDFLNKLSALVPQLHVTSGVYRELFPQARLVLNHAAAGDLNFRVFEALGCGACLVTPRVGHGLEELFTHGRELFIYDQNDIPGLAALLRELLAEPERCREVAAAGHAAVAAGHYMQHRAKTFADRISGLFSSGQAAAMIAERCRTANDIHKTYLRLLYLLHAESAPTPSARSAYLRAAKG